MEAAEVAEFMANLAKLTTQEIAEGVAGENAASAMLETVEAEPAEDPAV
jgi:hypothetical protein